jgi:DNA-binding response OmpR family regulator
MGLILWIDQNTFATSLIERAFKTRSLPFYTVTTVEDFSYLVDDLNPVLIVLDDETFSKNPAAFLEQYQNSAKMQALPFILLEPKSDFSFIKNKIGEITRPLKPFELPEILAKIVSAS